MHWLAFAFMTIASWGLYVNVIHIGTKAVSYTHLRAHET